LISGLVHPILQATWLLVGIHDSKKAPWGLSFRKWWKRWRLA